MRQKAGRKTLGDVAADFEFFVRVFDSEREAESRQNMRLLQEMMVGCVASGEKLKESEDWNWRYHLRPCTTKGCTEAWYSIFDEELFTFYTKPRRSNIAPLPTMCQGCATKDVEAAETHIKEKREELDDEEWVMWMEKLRKDREVEKKFWEQAQERIVRQRGPSYHLVEKTKEVELVEGKGADALRELCVVM